jgi:methylenetetrahydrofolate dehydrogenase (NADP+)/methenyltetrahydrofolate cyclohydrolase
MARLGLRIVRTVVGRRSRPAWGGHRRCGPPSPGAGIVPAMAATVIDGTAVAARVRAQVAAEVESLVAAGRPRPGLATIIVGEDAASQIYVGGKQRATEELGMAGFDRRLSADSAHDEVAGLIAELNADERVSGILLQLPVPGHLDGDALSAAISAAKDVDGLTPVSAGLLASGRSGLRPCTPTGVVELLDVHDVALEGAEAVVVGRSNLVGKPLFHLLLERNATVTVCHSRTRDLPEVCRRADVLVAAVGVPELVKGDWVKPGAAVIDVGMNRLESGLVGDVEYEAAAQRAGLITPVPGGVGPMTIAMLLRNTLTAAEATAGEGAATAQAAG